MIKIGLVGAGIIANDHKAAIYKNDNCVMSCVCDIAVERAEALAKGTGAKVYTDYREMAEKEDLDGVIINLPHFLHKEATICFLEHNIPTLIEKPMAMSVAECDEMIQAAQRTGTPLAVGHVQRYFTVHRYVKKLAESGKLGRLCSVTETKNKDYFNNRPGWFLKKELAGGGILMNYGAHSLDRLYHVTGLSPMSVHASGNNFISDDDVEATAQLLVKLEGGAGALLNFCGCHTPGYDEIVLYYTDATVKIVGCEELWIAEGANPFYKVELEKNDIIGLQMKEFIKFIQGEENELATPSHGKKIIAVLEEALKQIGD